MKITREQVEAWNKKCGNGFKVNARQAVLWGQKCLHKYIRLRPEYVLETSIEWRTERDVWGQKLVYPVLWFNEWHEEGDLMSSTLGMGYEVKLQEDGIKRKNFNYLLQLSNADDGLKDEQLIKLFERLSQEKEVRYV
mgnify:FL=1